MVTQTEFKNRGWSRALIDTVLRRNVGNGIPLAVYTSRNYVSNFIKQIYISVADDPVPYEMTTSSCILGRGDWIAGRGVNEIGDIFKHREFINIILHLESKLELHFFRSHRHSIQSVCAC